MKKRHTQNFMQPLMTAAGYSLGAAATVCIYEWVRTDIQCSSKRHIGQGHQLVNANVFCKEDLAIGLCPYL